MSTSTAQQPSPQLFFQTINAHQRTEALKAAIELEVFTAIGEGNTTAAEIAKRCHTSERGMRILCDYLTIMEMLTKKDNAYALTLDSATFLDKRSPAYLGTAIEFLAAPELTEGSKHIADAVRKGGTAIDNEGTIKPDNPIWVKFARGMAPMMMLALRRGVVVRRGRGVAHRVSQVRRVVSRVQAQHGHLPPLAARRPALSPRRAALAATVIVVMHVCGLLFIASAP